VKQVVTWPALIFWRAFFWTYERATWQYDLMVVAILAFVWLIPPRWLGDPIAHDSGLVAWMVERLTDVGNRE
jgi:hypothetical protein